MGKKNKDSLGRSLIKDRFSKNRHKKHVEDNSMVNYLLFHIRIKVTTYADFIYIHVS